MRPLLLALLLVGYAAVFVRMPSCGAAAGAFEPLDARGREVEHAIEQGRFADALPVARDLSRQHPGDATIQYWLAETFRGLGQSADEAGALERVFDLTRVADAACPALPEAYARAGALAKALSAYQRCAVAAPDDAERWLDLARARLASGQAVEAHDAFEKSRVLDPSNPRLPAAGTADDVARAETTR